MNLLQCMQYILNRIRSLNEFCVICDERHVLETGLIKVVHKGLIIHLLMCMNVVLALCVHKRALCVCFPNSWSYG